MRQTPTELTAAEPRAGRVRLFPFSYARFATKQQECLDENSEAEVECWKPGRAVSRVSPHLIVQRSRESTNGTPVVISLTTADLIAYLEKERQEEESCGWNAQLYDSMTPYSRPDNMGTTSIECLFLSDSHSDFKPGETTRYS